MSEMALTADHLIVIGQGRLLADTLDGRLHRRRTRASLRPDALPAAGAAAGRCCTRARRSPPSSPATARWRSTAPTTEQLGELAAGHQLVLHELSPQQASLEEAFMRLTAESVEYHAHSGPADESPTAGPGDRSGGRGGPGPAGVPTGRTRGV